MTIRSGEKIYLAQDTGLFGDMKLIGDEGLDLAVLPIGDNYTMRPGRCAARGGTAAPQARGANPLQHL